MTRVAGSYLKGCYRVAERGGAMAISRVLVNCSWMGAHHASRNTQRRSGGGRGADDPDVTRSSRVGYALHAAPRFTNPPLWCGDWWSRVMGTLQTIARNCQQLRAGDCPVTCHKAVT